MTEPNLKMPTWDPKDFVVEKIKKSEYKNYLKKYPNLSWGTCIIDNQENEYIIQRFISKEMCLFYCTAPTLIDLGYNITGNN